MGQSQTKTHIETFNPKKYLTKAELVSIKYVFEQLKTNFPDNFQCIEQKQFLARLDLPKELEEGAGLLLFKAFSFLGSYPSCQSEGPVPLSLNAFLTAFVVLTGHLDQPDQVLSESLFLKALSILPEPSVQEEEEEATTAAEENTHGTVLSLESLGIDFNDLEIKPTLETGPEILCRDLIELVSLSLWLAGNHQLAENHQVAGATLINLDKSKEGTCLSHTVFQEWKSNLFPHFFKPIQNFLVQTFSFMERKPLELPSIPSDLLSRMDSTLLCWALGTDVKIWSRLYSAQKDGFSMNRFESHVFKYPGPTLMLMRVETEDGQRMLIGASVTQAWKCSRQFWGTEDCVLFELEPHFDIFRATKKNERYIHYDHETGIGFGARERAGDFIISLRNTLQEGIYENEAYPRSPTFRSSTQRTRDFKHVFETENIEVFGLGTERDRERQRKEWEFERGEANRRSGLNIRLSDGNVDKEILKMAGIIEERQER